MTRKEIIAIAITALRNDQDADGAVIAALSDEPGADEIPECDFGCEDIDEDGLVDEIVATARDMLCQSA
jgi:hypothetical protein